MLLSSLSLLIRQDSPLVLYSEYLTSSKNYQIMQVGKAADRLEQYLTDNQVAITALSKNTAAKNMASLEQQVLMKAFQEGLGSFELLFVVDANGIIKNTFPYTNFGGKVDFTDRQWYKDVVREKKTVISDTYVSAFTKQATAPIIAPVYGDKGTILGYIGGNLSLGNLSSLVGPLSSGNTGKGIILDKNKFYLIDSRDETKGKSHEEFKEEKIKNMISGGKAQWNQFGDELVVYAPVGTTGWSILSTQPYYEFMGKTRELRDTIILVIGIAILFTTMIIGIIGFIGLRKTIIDPVARLSVVAREIAKGDFRQHHISYDGNNEIGFLAKSFGEMVKGISDIIRQVTNTASAVSDYSKQLSLSSEQSAQASNQVATSIMNISNGIDFQAQALDGTTKAIHEISVSIDNLAINSESVVIISDSASTAAKEGAVLIDAAVAEMEKIKNTVSSSAKVMTKLGDSSVKINQIIETISQIAGQTNLLALNAAIEAARAGEQGRGFAVVAEEVRKLAEQSQRAALEITAIIGGIQADTSQAVDAINQGTDEVNSGTKVVFAAGEAFNNIVNLTNDVSFKVKEIADEVQEIAQNSKLVVTSASEVDKYSKDVAGQTQNVSAVTQEQSAAIEEIASSSHNLAQLAQELQTAIEKFQV